MKESFLLYTSFYEPLKTLSNEQLGKLFKAIFEYEINGIEDVETDIQIAFAFIKNQLLLDSQKYEAKCQKNKENGKLGGRPKANKANGNSKTKRFKRKPKRSEKTL